MIRIKHNKTNKRTNWHNLVYGCKQLDIPIAEDPMLTEEFNKTCQGKDGLQLLEIYFDDKKKRVWLDNGNFTYRFYPEVLEGNNDLYFKITLHQDHIDRGFGRVFPYAESMYDPVRFEHNRDKLLLLTSKRNYRWDVGGLFRSYAKGNREACIKEILKHNWNSKVGACGKGVRIPSTMSDNWKIPLEEQWEFEAQTKINIGLRGCGYWDFRTTIAWGIGAGIMMFPEEGMIEFPHNKPIYIAGKEDYSDLAKLINYYLENEEERLAIANNGLKYYENYITPVSAIMWILNKCEEHFE